VIGLVEGAAVSPPSSGISIWLLAGIILAAVSASIALGSLRTTRSFNARRELADLLQRLETSRLDLLMWRMDQATRRGLSSSSLAPKDVDELFAGPDAMLVKQALGSDRESLMAHMLDVYHFALRVHTWLAPDQGSFLSFVASGLRPATRVRLLNDTFGYRLLGTFLDHRIVACRLRRGDQGETYYATQYGLFDPRYSRLVTTLYDDLAYGDNMGADLWAVPKKHEAITTYLKTAVPTNPLVDTEAVRLAPFRAK
jgi:hypothetical protein